jgi:predicted transcriptional regulator of viral defense system
MRLKLKDYKRPNDKINTLKSEGLLESIKKGLYIAGPKIASAKPENSLLANHILGPSYVSVDTALSYYGLIPERVHEIASMTTKASR